MSFIDIHSHILPAVDDGAKSFEEAIELLKQEKEQGVDAVMLTPHFYPEFTSLDEHLTTVNNAFALFKEQIKNLDLPEIFLGHEVQCYPQIARSSGLENCTLSNSYYLLLELPFLNAIPQETVREIIRLSEDLGFRVIIAHIERYALDKQYKKILSLAKKDVVLLQVNAESLNIAEFKKPVEKLLKQNLISFVGSDAHSIKQRPVRIKNFLTQIRNTYPSAYSKIVKETNALYTDIKGEAYVF